jgi:hypothetical protein
VALFAIVPFVLQAVAMGADEAFYHRARGLPRWERVGHVLDSLTVATCYAWLLGSLPSRANAIAYGTLAAASCLFVTKDEGVHAGRCSAGEHWVHAVLFVLHPVVLIAAGWLWWTHQLRGALVVQLVLTAAFALYQLLYWNRHGPWQRTQAPRAA